MKHRKDKERKKLINAREVKKGEGQKAQQRRNKTETKMIKVNPFLSGITKNVTDSYHSCQRWNICFQLSTELPFNFIDLLQHFSCSKMLFTMCGSLTIRIAIRERV